MILQQIKHLYAKDKGYEGFLDMISDMTDVEVDIATDKVARLFAKTMLDEVDEWTLSEIDGLNEALNLLDLTSDGIKQE